MQPACPLQRQQRWAPALPWWCCKGQTCKGGASRAGETSGCSSKGMCSREEVKSHCRMACGAGTGSVLLLGLSPPFRGTAVCHAAGEY